MIRRAYDLRLIDAAKYQRGYKYIAAQGWLKGEPEEPEPEHPELVRLSLEQLEKHYGTTAAALCARLNWRPRLFERVAGVAIAVGDEPVSKAAPVVQLSLIRAEREGRRS